MIFSFGNLAIYFKIKPVNVATFIIVAEIKGRAAIFQGLIGKSGPVVFISIGPKVNPDVIKGVRRIVVISYRLAPC